MLRQAQKSVPNQLPRSRLALFASAEELSLEHDDFRSKSSCSRDSVLSARFRLSDDSASSHRALAKWLDGIGPVTGTRILVLGKNTLEVMCALIRRGCPEAAELRLDHRPEAQSTDLVLVPHVGSLDDAQQAVAQARRALVPSGRVMLRIVPSPSGQVARGVERLLREEGFSAIWVRPLLGGTLICAERPASLRLAAA